MSEAISNALRQWVIQQAGECCEYCRLHQSHTLLPHHIDHIISRKHGGQTEVGNLALACADCNWAKGSDIASVDSQTGQPIFFFHPRRQEWRDHFRLDQAHIAPLTPEGQVTAAILQFNTPQRIAERAALQQLGLYPLE